MDRYNQTTVHHSVALWYYHVQVGSSSRQWLTDDWSIARDRRTDNFPERGCQNELKHFSPEVREFLIEINYTFRSENSRTRFPHLRSCQKLTTYAGSSQTYPIVKYCLLKCILGTMTRPRRWRRCKISYLPICDLVIRLLVWKLDVRLISKRPKIFDILT